ncbi:MAG: acyl-CoA thioesterase/bile acid-CoA:amino acid N-acyltransferase family protein [Solibacillus sp.]|uniref:acyl-CoA thioesterase/bile acid-CoA:amino acid N-acyltransferase family protein n=1 Tax=Solibacillus sp. TaxID=1909654 RepID=UPI00331613DB
MKKEATGPRILVSKQFSMIDETIDIEIIGLKPFEEVVIEAKRLSSTSNPFYLQSYATYIANDKGEVNLASQEPINGTYFGVEPMGLFWSLERIDDDSEITASTSEVHSLSPQSVRLSLFINNEEIHQVTIQRLWQAPHITRESIRVEGLVGTFFYEKNATKPGIIVVGGSEGGIYEYPSTLLAAHGFSVLALGYFGVDGLPKSALNIPLEYIKTAIDWMKKQDEVADGWLGMHGTSKGAELALLAASLFSDIRAVVALNGFAVPFSAIVPWTDDEFLPPAWQYKGKPLPYLSPNNPVEVALACKEMWNEKKGNPLGMWYAALASNPTEVKNAIIPVEKINGSILLIGGDADEVDTVGLSKLAVDRIKEKHSNNVCEQLIYANAGHAISIPNIVQSFVQGTKHDTNFASKDSWEKTIAFFHNSYKKV